MLYCCSNTHCAFVVKDDTNICAACNHLPKPPQPPATSFCNRTIDVQSNKNTPAHPFSASPWQSSYPAGVAPLPAMTSRKIFNNNRSDIGDRGCD
ncbi:hypothetical protein CsSME_00031255 [Camellia sinensis var. sinensis]